MGARDLRVLYAAKKRGTEGCAHAEVFANIAVCVIAVLLVGFTAVLAGASLRFPRTVSEGPTAPSLDLVSPQFAQPVCALLDYRNAGLCGASGRARLWLYPDVSTAHGAGSIVGGGGDEALAGWCQYGVAWSC